jgi:prevent-host-death family protein
MARVMDLEDAKTNLSALVDEAAAGEEIVIAKDSKPKARLVALVSQHRPRPFGLYQGRVHVADDFDAPWPEEIRRALEGGNPIEPEGVGTFEQP